MGKSLSEAKGQIRNFRKVFSPATLHQQSVEIYYFSSGHSRHTKKAFNETKKKGKMSNDKKPSATHKNKQQRVNENGNEKSF